MKKMNNKGFSLVELIIVIAIMAVLMGVLAPQLLRHVETSRLQSDLTAMSEVDSATTIAISSSENIYKTLTAGTTVTIENGEKLTSTNSDLEAELLKTIPNEMKLTSKSCKEGTFILTIKYDSNAKSYYTEKDDTWQDLIDNR